MTDTPDWVLKEAAKRCDWHPSKTLAQMRGYLSSSAAFTALCRAIEQHEAFRQEVSDAVEVVVEVFKHEVEFPALERFIIPKPKPDPLVEVLNAVTWTGTEEQGEQMAVDFRAALEARGLTITTVEKD